MVVCTQGAEAGRSPDFEKMRQKDCKREASRGYVVKSLKKTDSPSSGCYELPLILNWELHAHLPLQAPGLSLHRSCVCCHSLCESTSATPLLCLEDTISCSHAPTTASASYSLSASFYLTILSLGRWAVIQLINLIEMSI